MPQQSLSILGLFDCCRLFLRVFVAHDILNEGYIFPNNTSFGVFSHSKGFGAELLSDSLWFSGADLSWAAKRFRGRFHQRSTKVPPRFSKFPPRFSKFHLVFDSLGQIRLGLPKGSAEGSKVARRLRKFRHLAGFLGQIPFFSERVLRRVPPSLLYICLPVPSTLFRIFAQQCWLWGLQP